MYVYIRWSLGTAVTVLMLWTVGWSGEVRTWSSDTGKFRIEAEFVSLKDGKVRLRKPGVKKLMTVSLDRLSEQDQAYVRQLTGDDGSAQEQNGAEATGAQASGDVPSQSTSEPSNSTATNKPRRSNAVLNSVRGAVYRNETLQNLRQIGIALINFESTQGRFPPAAIMTSDGKPGLSWRVAILPMLEEDNLYRQFHRNEPWDSLHNKQLVERMPKVFSSPGSDLDEGFTNYLAVVGPRSIIVPGRRGVSAADVRDGTSNTIMVVEVDDTHAAVWTKPDDYVWDPAQPLAGLGNIWLGQFFAVFADGAARRMSAELRNEEINGFFTRNGGEAVQLDE